MSEESISCSPGCDAKRSQSRRLHKSFKERHQRRKNPPSSFDVPRLEALYEDSNPVLDTTQYDRPFDNVKPLAAADLVRLPKPSFPSKEISSKGFVKIEELPLNENEGYQEEAQPSKHHNSDSHEYHGPETRFGITESGFEKIEELPLNENEGYQEKAKPSNHRNSVTHEYHGPETQFGITESEFVRFCDDAEMDEKEPAITPVQRPQNKKTIVEMILEDFCGSQPSESPTKSVVEKEEEQIANTPSETRKNAKSIVEAILEDFCASPYVESPPKLAAENATPIFRFRSKSIRTYAGVRQRRLRRNIETELASAILSDDDGNVSDSSGLSVQEDLTQTVVPQLDTVDLNSSIKVCENLLHLSSYFSQTTSQDKTPSSSEEQKSRPVPDVVEEILQLKRGSYEITRRKSEDEFYGFSDGDSLEEFYGFSDEEEKSKEDPFKELLEAGDDILQQIECDSHCYDEVRPKSSSGSELRQVDCDSLCYDEVRPKSSSGSELRQVDCDSLCYDEVRPKSSSVSELKLDLGRAQSVIEEAKQFMLSLEGLHGGEADDKSVGDNLKRQISQDSPVSDDKLFEDIDLWNDNECLLNYATQKPSHNQEAQGNHEDNVSTTRNVRFLTASKRPIAISKEAERKASEFLSKFEQMETETKLDDNGAKAIANCAEDLSNGQAVSGNPNFLGFTTASRKPVVISEAARTKAEQIIKQFEKEDREQLGGSNTHLKAPASSENLATATKEKTVEAEEKAHKKDRKPCELPKKITEEAEELLKDIEFFEERFEEEDKADELPTLNAYTKEQEHHQSVFEGFKTASRKPIQVSEEAKRRADQLVRDVQAESVPKDFLECIRADLELVPSDKSLKEERVKSVETAFEGFKTASKKPIQVSQLSKRKAEQIFKEIQTNELPREFLECIEADLKFDEVPIRVRADQEKVEATFEGFKTASKNSIQVSDVAKPRVEQMLTEVESTELPKEFLECVEADLTKLDRGRTETPFEGFKTASKKAIQVSDSAKRRAEQIFNEVQTDPLPQDFVKCMEADMKGESVPIAARNNPCAKEPLFEGFKTASRKQIKISDTAKQRANQILKEVENTDLPQDFLKCIQADLKENPIPLERGTDALTPIFEGFKTASKKPIQISDPARQRAEKFLKEIEANDLPPDFIECIQSDLESECGPKAEPALAKNEPHHTPSEKTPSKISPQKLREPENRKAIKRKSEACLTIEHVSSPKRRFSCNERTPLNGIENAQLHKTASHPDIKSTQKLSKKNLLSLSKRKKVNSPKAAAPEVSSVSKTPEKPDSALLRCNVNTTPNLKEFFKCVTTSTPRLSRAKPLKADINTKDSSMDADFQKINWENVSNSARVCKTGSFTDLNVTCVEVSPSPKQRIERLKMYGEPPPISPILMVNKCRPSGLRRGRSLLKP